MAVTETEKETIPHSRSFPSTILTSTSSLRAIQQNQHHRALRLFSNTATKNPYVSPRLTASRKRYKKEPHGLCAAFTMELHRAAQPLQKSSPASIPPIPVPADRKNESCLVHDLRARSRHCHTSPHQQPPGKQPQRHKRPLTAATDPATSAPPGSPPLL